jgi:predicted transcriptional regulator
MKNKEATDVKKSFKDLKDRLKKLNNLFQKKEKDPPSKLQNSMTYSKNRSYELNAKMYKSGKNSPRKYDFDSNYENLEKKISNLKRNFNMKGKILECDKQIVNQSNEGKDESSDINLDEITDSIISITKHHNQPENNSRSIKNNDFYLDVDMTYISN